ncbi:uncharacterized protein [Montipora foliosa]|uniref:uncharacterized protein n=1 Tax=Montipora foliosa TaxID=591990 RepID=UPI0035F1A020
MLSLEHRTCTETMDTPPGPSDAVHMEIEALMNSDEEESLAKSLGHAKEQNDEEMDWQEDEIDALPSTIPMEEEEVPQQFGGGGNFRFVLEPLVEHRSTTMGVREGILRTCSEQQWRFNINTALAQGLSDTVEIPTSTIPTSTIQIACTCVFTHHAGLVTNGSQLATG